MPDTTSPPPGVSELTELAERTPQLKAHLVFALTRLMGPQELSFAFHRHWNGGWRVRVDLAGDRVRTIEFALLVVNTSGAVLPLPRPFPDAWRRRTGFPATDGTVWTERDDGAVVPFAG
ncbi:MAG: hypothetical protein HY275_11825 [Gemmatimonadetes bacterium]|nr:hypothetical protein [Gemmatimonadota bacterium]